MTIMFFHAAEKCESVSTHSSAHGPRTAELSLVTKSDNKALLEDAGFRNDGTYFARRTVMSPRREFDRDMGRRGRALDMVLIRGCGRLDPRLGHIKANNHNVAEELEFVFAAIS